MKYRRFGRTELQMPVFTCGGMRYQQKWDDLPLSAITPENQKNLEATIVRSLELGINHIETARGYGTSEMQLGQILPKLPREKMIVQTKVGPSWWSRTFRKTFETSMKYLGLDYVDLLSLHGVNDRKLLHDSLKRGGCLAEARKLQKEGRCRFVGFSTHATTDIILEAIREGDFDYMNVHWYFVNNLNWVTIEEAARRDMGVFIISPNDKGGKLYSPPQKLVDLCAPLSPMIFNDLYCLARPQVHTLSLGAARPTDFDEHVKALEFYDDIPKIIPPVVARLEAEMDRVVGRDWRERWPEGLPNYTEVPGEVNVTEILRLWTYAKSLDLVDWGKMRYNLLGNAGHWFPGKNAASVPVPPDAKWQKTIANSPFKDRIPEILREAHEMLLDAPKQRLSKS
jgi:predicted aldo/keto reductase-like oxidoreductase